MTERPLILVCNDDGIDADGLWLLAAAMRRHGDVMVAAPAFNQSGASAALTLHRDIESERAHSRIDGVDAWQINGAPVDAVSIGLRRHASRRVRMIVSGVNPGSNVGRDMLHSGTVMAAMQGYVRGLPAVAVSSGSVDGEHLGAAAQLGAAVAGWLLARGAAELLNVNAPNCPFAEIAGLEITHAADESFSRLVDFRNPDGSIRRQLVPRDGVELPPGSDIAALVRGAASITPLHSDLTAHAALPQLREAIDGFDPLAAPL